MSAPASPLAPAAAPAIELVAVHKKFVNGKQTTVAVDGLDLVVQRGEVFGLLGPNGAGKTTTIEMCEGLTEPDAGTVRVLGRQWGRGEDDAIRARIGVCLQKTEFHEKATVREVLQLFASFYGRGRAVDEVLALVSLQEKANARQSTLSGGQRQRLAVATALVGAPELLFLDEPTTGLDPQSRRQLWDVVRAFRKGGGTVVLTTHYMDEAQQLCDRIGIVDRGRRIALGTPTELIRTLGAEHFVTAEVDDPTGAIALPALLALPDVVAAERDGRELRLTVRSVHTALPALLALLVRHAVPLHGLATRSATLEDVFVHLTGRHLREDAA
ncbi:MAG: ABC transporter ATP-binding protein [Planctomycetota bacterium]|jgi:ABC-2 type transport system ATP-binding protein